MRGSTLFLRAISPCNGAQCSYTPTVPGSDIWQKRCGATIPCVLEPSRATPPRARSARLSLLPSEELAGVPTQLGRLRLGELARAAHLGEQLRRRGGDGGEEVTKQLVGRRGVARVHRLVEEPVRGGGEQCDLRPEERSGASEQVWRPRSAQ